MASEVGVIERPPRAVQRSSRGIRSATRLAVVDDLVEGDDLGRSRRAPCWRRPARWRRPSRSCPGRAPRRGWRPGRRSGRACSAAPARRRRPPARRAAGERDEPAAAIAAAAPPSAWQPPTSAAKDQRRAMNTPTRPAASMRPGHLLLVEPPSTRPARSPRPGRAAQAPAVGAATITPIELFTSISAVRSSTIRLSTGPPSSRPSARAAAKPAPGRGGRGRRSRCRRSPPRSTLQEPHDRHHRGRSTSRSVKPPRAIS